MYANHWAVHRDPKLWEYPDTFNPERFIDDNGEFIYSPYVISLGYGARYCPGKKMSERIIFHIITAIIGRFQLLPESGVELPSLDESCSGATISPFPFKVIFKPR